MQPNRDHLRERPFRLSALPIRFGGILGPALSDWTSKTAELDTSSLANTGAHRPSSSNASRLIYGSSAVTSVEIRLGIAAMPTPRGGQAQRRARAADTGPVMLKWRLIVEHGRKAGDTYSQHNLIITATVLHYGLTTSPARRRNHNGARGGSASIVLC